jgi:hypothetical protein
MAKPHPSEPRPVEWVTEDEIRRIFNDGHYYERVLDGKLVSFVQDRNHKAPPSEPFCTWSEILVYYTQALDRVAIVHQYLRPDNSIGASGRPDPKCIFLQDKTLKVRLKRSSS